MTNRQRLLDLNSSLEFKLHRLYFISLLNGGIGNQLEALQYARHFQPFASQHQRGELSPSPSPSQPTLTAPCSTGLGQSNIQDKDVLDCSPAQAPHSAHHGSTENNHAPAFRDDDSYPPFVTSDIQILMGSLVYLRHGIENSPYRTLLETNQWAEICNIFTRDACALLGLSVESPLSVR